MRAWVYDFREPLPPGVRCDVKVRPVEARVGPMGAHEPLSGRSEWSFSTGGPAIVSTQPWEGAQIEEDQHFY
jgi:hypothetical protein